MKLFSSVRDFIKCQNYQFARAISCMIADSFVMYWKCQFIGVFALKFLFGGRMSSTQFCGEIVIRCCKVFLKSKKIIGNDTKSLLIV